VYAGSLKTIIGGVIVSSMIYLPLVLSPYLVLCFIILFAGKPAK
jgi:hypothetical protein